MPVPKMPKGEMMSDPSTTAGNGRDPGGRFVPGNRFARGNPHASRVAKLRTAALAAVTQRDLKAILRKLVALALAGNVAAAREILSRTLGPADAIDIVMRIEALESHLLQRRSYDLQE